MPPSAPELLWTFLRLGAQSFGGGSTTLILIRREVVERKGWMADADFTRDWAPCQATPGINLVGITLLVGWRLRGFAGIAATLAGLLFPSVLITVALAATYGQYRDSQVLAAALKGVLPATVGLGLVNSVQMAKPLLAASRSESKKSLALSICLIVAAAAASFLRLPVALVLAGSAGIGALAHWRLPMRELSQVETND